jgi:hypothetical protein
MLDFRQWWADRLEAQDLTPNSANKDLVHLGDVLRTVNKMKRLGLHLPLSDLAFKEGEARQRPPFSTEWIRDKILGPGALGGLNTEARCILLGMVNTGYRPSEGAGLLPEHIRLDGTVPYISIEPEGRQLKSAYARRLIPLTGVSLEAFRQSREGFPRYRRVPQACPLRSTSFSARISCSRRQPIASTACAMPSRTECWPLALMTESGVICSAIDWTVNAMGRGQTWSICTISFSASRSDGHGPSADD